MKKPEEKLKQLLKSRAGIIRIVRLEAIRTNREADLQIDYERLKLKLKSVAKTPDGNVRMETLFITDLTRDTGKRLWRSMKQHFERAPV